ncbi:hypothetical protein [Flavobacterium psychrophilum]|uniref:hypothetical protein n=1 Tax=Flavobacterium psychrophilum TaxID=96345 RepID=UPI001C8F58F9|nr:hypothetical protein [Flavobacterium psychrophilum]QZK98179.1 hypothetical protein K5L05_00385 [Flavobacterium psychrophilum]
MLDLNLLAMRIVSIEDTLVFLKKELDCLQREQGDEPLQQSLISLISSYEQILFKCKNIFNNI